MKNSFKLNPHGQVRKYLLLPLFLLLLLTAGSVSYYLWQATRLLDQREAGQNALLAQAALACELDDLSVWADDYAYRAALSTARDHGREPAEECVSQDLGRTINGTHNFTSCAIFDSGNRLRAGRIPGKSMDNNFLPGSILQQLNSLLKEARNLSPSTPKATSGLLEIEGDIYLAAAQVTLSSEAPKITPGNSQVLLLLKKIDDPLLKKISQHFPLHGLHLTRTRPKEENTSIELTSFDGRAIGHLEWRPVRPGQRIFRTLAPAIPVPLLLAVLLILFFLRRMHYFFRERMSLYEQIEKEKLHLETSEGTLRTIVGAIPSPLFFKDPDGNYLGCNQAYRAYLCCASDEVIGRTTADLIPSDWARSEHRTDLQLLRKGGGRTYEDRVLYADGITRDVLINKICIDSQQGRRIGLVGIMTDISEIKQAQRESRRLRKLLRNIIDAMPSMLITVDGEQHITEWNRWAAVASGVPASRALDRPLLEVFPQLAAHNIDLTTALQSQEIKTWSSIPWKLRNREIFVDLTIYPLGKKTNSGAVLRADDATNRVRMEEMMVLSEKMVSIGSLAAGLAHEINNPLAIVLQNTQILANRLNPELDKNRAVAEDCGIDLNTLQTYLNQRGIVAMLDAIRQAGNRAKLIVEDMVNFARCHKTAFNPCDLPSLIDETLHLANSDYDLKKRFAFREIKIELQIEKDLPQLICDRHDLQQALLNLLRNSAKALRTTQNPSPKITVAAGCRERNLWITVADNGPGIKPAILNRIFDPFFSTGKIGEGTGLGLSATYFIICDKHGGNIQVENLPEAGCEFRLEIPLDRNLPQEAFQQ